ncbi:hypothetical protein ACFUIV_27560 [Streptomyces anulatus]
MAAKVGGGDAEVTAPVDQRLERGAVDERLRRPDAAPPLGDEQVR